MINILNNKTIKKNILYLSIILFILALFCFISSILAFKYQWDGYNCTHIYIDTYSGEILYQRYIFFFKKRDEVVSTEFSKLVHKYYGDINEHNWKRAATEYYIFHSSVGMNTSHNKYHKVISDFNGLMRLFVMFEINEKKQKELIGKCLNFLQKRYFKEIDDLVNKTFNEYRKLEDTKL